MLTTKFQFIWLRGFRGEDRPWRPCLLMDRNKMSTLYRGPHIDTSYKVSVLLAKRLQKRIIFKSANQKQESPVAAMFVNVSGRNEQSL